MKYCISARQPNSVLKKADEIKFSYRDKEKIIDCIENFPDKTFILTIPKGYDYDYINWDLYKVYSEKVRFIMALDDLSLAPICKEKGILFYWTFPVTTWYELDSVIKLNPCYLFINDSLIFNLEKIKQKTNIPLRACPNLCYNDRIPRENGIYGAWIRPEDVEVYEQYIDTFEFYYVINSEEEALLNAYTERVWPGNLNLLLVNLNVSIDNRALPEEIGETRANCGRRCMEHGSCHFCETAFLFANSIRKKHYKDKKINPIEEN